MTSPLYQSLQEVVKQDHARFHTPGHKGIPTLPLGDALKWDLTELPGTDSLYEADGAIRESEERFSALYGCTTLLSAGGSTLCIQAMLALVVREGGQLMVGRGCHSSVIHSMALLGLEPQWIYPQLDPLTGLALPFTPSQVAAEIAANPHLVGVLVTSPDYYGQMQNIPGISQLCKEAKIPLLVDSAHGAHLPFVKGGASPIALGADLACSSLHKTLPAMTGAALLHLSERFSRDSAKGKMALFGSTSPSYPILLSADLLLPLLETTVPSLLEALCRKVAQAKTHAAQVGFLLPTEDSDPIRLTLGFGAIGYSKGDFQALLAHHQITPEYTDDYYTILLPGIFQPQKDWDRLEEFFSSVQPSAPRPIPQWQPLRLPKVCSLREATLGQSRLIPTQEALGKTVAATVAPCPPGIPLVVPGEQLNQQGVTALENHGVSQIHVL